MTELRGKIALVTGAGSGVGRATAIALAREGATTVLVSRTREPLEETARLVEAAGGRCLVAPADVGDEAAVRGMVEGATRLLGGGVDILVAAAGVGLYGPVETYGIDDWQATLATNLTGVFLCCREVLPAMRARGAGAIVAIGSGAGKQGYANLAAYSASKFGLLGLTQSLAAEVGEHGIRVSTVLPGSIASGFAGKRMREVEEGRAAGRKYLEPEDVADAVMFLLRQREGAWTQELNLWPV